MSRAKGYMNNEQFCNDLRMIGEFLFVPVEDTMKAFETLDFLWNHYRRF